MVSQRRALLALVLVSSLLEFTFGKVVLNHDTQESERWCRWNACIRKCCPERQLLANKTCAESSEHEFTFKSYDGLREITDATVVYHVLHSNSCRSAGRFKLSPDYDEADEFYVQRNGTLLKPKDDVMPRVSYQFYCLENFLFSDRVELSAIVCYNDGDLEATADKQNACYVDGMDSKSAIWCLLLFIGNIFAEPCPDYLSVNITDGAPLDHDRLLKDGIVYDQKNYYRSGGAIFGCVCNLRRCLRKCCGKNEVFVNDTCVESPGRAISFPVYNLTQEQANASAGLFVVYGGRCLNTHDSIRADGARLYLQTDGSVYYVEDDYTNIYSVENYCIDIVDGVMSGFTCEEKESGEETFIKGNVRKCCASDQVMIGKTKTCEKSRELFKSTFLPALKSKTSVQNLVHKELNCGKNYKRLIISDFRVDDDGSFYWDDTEYAGIKFYCIDLFTIDSAENELRALVCVGNEEIVDSTNIPVAAEFHIRGIVNKQLPAAFK
ncbi:unnamed protein product [Phyllotreta striolata]|uniref:Methuselah N-terminal domain-containing protein n=1 Tax=Phyllotreta striolata TaxID=444603 RepID=A0A9N9TLH8_PHYSR|nr:unnamed protein product [Phyllotreta striolata]